VPYNSCLKFIHSVYLKLGAFFPTSNCYSHLSFNPWLLPLFYVLLKVWIFGFCMWPHVAFILLCLAYFIYHNVLKFHSFVENYRISFLIKAEYYSSRCVCVYTHSCVYTFLYWFISRYRFIPYFSFWE
jgi:hypothetical protein